MPELSDASPYLSDPASLRFQRGMTDAVYEWLPQQVMGLLKFSRESIELDDLAERVEALEAGQLQAQAADRGLIN